MVCHPDDRCISVAVPYATDKDQYSLGEFAKQVVSRFRRKCPLCGKRHSVKIHTYVDRTYKNPQKEEEDTEGQRGGKSDPCIVVPRLYCPVNYRLRKDTGQPKQYTITVLPGFLIPYSRILVDTIHAALHGYLHGDAQARSYEQAAYMMNCAQPVSFARYLGRVKQRLSAWIVTLTTLLVDLGADITQTDEQAHGGQDLSEQWMYFLYLVTKTVQAKVIAEPLRWQYVYGLFSYQRMGLGP